MVNCAAICFAITILLFTCQVNCQSDTSGEADGELPFGDGDGIISPTGDNHFK